MAEIDKPQREVDVPGDWTYASAPESRDIVQIRDRYGYYVGGEWLEPAETYETISPRDEEPLAAVGQASAEDVGRAVAAARTAYADGWSSLPGSERAKYLFRIARILQERSREFAVLESLNGGKPIKESRDVDLPLAAAHFFYYAGWADKLEYAFPNRRPRPVGVAGQIIPWNFPLLMLAWKVAPALACGNTVVLKPAETTPLTALLFCDVLRQAELPDGVVNIVTGDGRTGAALVESEDVDKIAFTGSTEVGKEIQRRLAGTGKKPHARARRQGREHRLRRRGARPGGRGDRQRDLLQPGARLLRRLAALRPGVDLRAARGEARAPPHDAARRRPARQEHRRRRHQLRRAAREDPRARRLRGRGGRRDLPAALRPPGEGLLVRADRVHERRAELPDRAGGDLRPGPLRPHLPHAGGGAREGEQHAVRAERRRLDGEGLAHPLDGAAPACRRRLGEHVQPLRPELAVRRLQGVRLRPRGRAARARAVSRSSRSRRPSVAERLPVKKTYKLFIGGAFPRSESGRTYEAEGQNVALASRKDVRDAVRAARGAQSGWAEATAYNRGQVLYRLAEMVEARVAEFAELCTGRDEVERSIDRIVWYAGWADKLPQVLGGSNPVAGPYFNFTVPEPTGVVAVLAPDEPPLLGLVTRAAPAARRRKRRRRGGVGDAAARGDRARGGARDERRARRCRQPPHGPALGARSGARLAHGRERDRHRRRERRRPGARARSPPTTSSASCAAAPTCRARGRSPRSSS